MRTHTGESSYQCSKCDKAFSTKLLTEKSYEITYWEQPYHCSQCYKYYLDISALKKTYAISHWG